VTPGIATETPAAITALAAQFSATQLRCSDLPDLYAALLSRAAALAPQCSLQQFADLVSAFHTAGVPEYDEMAFWAAVRPAVHDWLTARAVWPPVVQPTKSPATPMPPSPQPHKRLPTRQQVHEAANALAQLVLVGFLESGSHEVAALMSVVSDGARQVLCMTSSLPRPSKASWTPSSMSQIVTHASFAANHLHTSVVHQLKACKVQVPLCELPGVLTQCASAGCGPLLSMRNPDVPGGLDFNRLDAPHAHACCAACSHDANTWWHADASSRAQTRTCANSKQGQARDVAVSMHLGATPAWVAVQCCLAASTAVQAPVATWAELKRFASRVEAGQVPSDHPMITCATLALERTLDQLQAEPGSRRHDRAGLSISQAAQTAQALAWAGLAGSSTATWLADAAMTALKHDDGSTSPKQ
jgi:hypothetical protein